MGNFDALRAFRLAGFTIRLDGPDGIRVWPSNRITPAVFRMIRKHKREIIAALLAEQTLDMIARGCRGDPDHEPSD